MPIHILDSETIDRIAAGEVVERPSSVVKELVENAIDAGASAIAVEIKDGGIEFIRVTDNGSGMERDQIRTAFLRHATSKIENAEDLTRIASLGFRGEALSSIAAVSKVELITRTADSLTGTRMVLTGAVEQSFEEIGAPEGTTMLVRNLFFNTPVRRKFLKQPATEGGYVAELMEHLALSRPDISFQFTMGNQNRFYTSGNGDLKEVIYRIYGREVAGALVPIQYEQNGVRVDGFLGKPVMVRSNRSFEIYYINGRFVRSNVIARAIEEGYREYLMQHKFPFCVLHIAIDPEQVDVNVHPSKLDVRFTDGIAFCNLLSEAVRDTLRRREMIPDASPDAGGTAEDRAAKGGKRPAGPEPFEQRRSARYKVMEEQAYRAEAGASGQRAEFARTPVWDRVLGSGGSEEPKPGFAEQPESGKPPEAAGRSEAGKPPEAAERSEAGKLPEAAEPPEADARQMDFFEDRLLSADNRSRYRVIGQVFDTYWLIQFEDRLFIIDQHAAHEKVRYERLMEQYRGRQIVSQMLMPPVIVSLSGQEEAVWEEYRDTFAGLGFEVEAFGGSEYAIRSVPADLYGCGERELFLEVLDGLAEGARGGLKSVEEKIASMSCKAAVKGNHRMSAAEAEKLIDELLTLENPYNCPHGRPTIISMTRTELEKKFKRIV